jgi:hypothetical protein
MHIRGYFVAINQAEELWNWADRDFHGRTMPEGPSWIEYLFAGEYPHSVQAQRQLHGSYVEPIEDRVPVPVLPAVLDETASFEFDAYHESAISPLRPAKIMFDGTDLRWDGLGGYRHGAEPVFKMPNFSEPGPSAMLVEESWIKQWLAERDLALVWTVLSEKHAVPAGFGRRPDGYAVHSRAHRLRPDGSLESSNGISVRHRPTD